MRVDCEGCAGCCVDWRDGESAADHERRGPQEPLDDVYNLVPLSRDDVRSILAAGLADATTPRLWRAEGDRGVAVDGRRIAAIDGKPAFYLGLRTPPKPVAPHDLEPRWRPTCVFLDPETLQCRVHEAETYPAECAAYPGHNLALGAETECERVEAATGDERLLDDDAPVAVEDLLLGPQAIGQKVFVYPDREDLSGVVARAATGALTREDRARFAAAAAANAPGTTEVDEAHFASALDRARAADSWAGRAVADWQDLAGAKPPDPGLARRVETDRGAPETPGWND
ncbi:MAG: YkgJ family cysteine cluster protein [Halanaeroarchaeum sp.]